jgi:hypothetical protein
MGFHELPLSFLVIGALLAFTIFWQLVDRDHLLLLFFYIFIDLRLPARNYDGPYYQKGKPNWKDDNSNCGKCIGLVFGEIVDLTVPEIKGDFHIFFWALAGDANTCKRVNVSGSVLNGDQVVWEIGLLFAFVELAGVIGGDSGIHDGWKEGGYVRLENVLDYVFYEPFALFGLGLCRKLKQTQTNEYANSFHWI